MTSRLAHYLPRVLFAALCLVALAAIVLGLMIWFQVGPMGVPR